MKGWMGKLKNIVSSQYLLCRNLSLLKLNDGNLCNNEKRGLAAGCILSSCPGQSMTCAERICSIYDHARLSAILSGQGVKETHKHT